MKVDNLKAKNRHLDERFRRTWLDNRALKQQLQRKDGHATKTKEKIGSFHEVLEKGVMLSRILEPQRTEKSVVQRMKFFQRVEDSEGEREEGSGGRSDI